VPHAVTTAPVLIGTQQRHIGSKLACIHLRSSKPAHIESQEIQQALHFTIFLAENGGTDRKKIISDYTAQHTKTNRDDKSGTFILQNLKFVDELDGDVLSGHSHPRKQQILGNTAFSHVVSDASRT
jgi:hypothetical protein